MRMFVVTATALLTACASSAPGKDTSSTSASGASPCAAGDWGTLDVEPDLAVHVRADGDDATADGSLAAPFTTLEAALAYQREHADRTSLFLGPGTWTSFVDLGADLDGGFSDNGLAIVGCSAEEVRLRPAEASQPIVRVSGAQDIRLAGFTLEGGTRALWVWQGATARVVDVEIVGSTRVGAVFDGVATLLDLEDFWVRDPIAPGDGFGYGIQVYGAGMRMHGGGVVGARTAGIIVSEGLLDLEDIVISDTTPSLDGTFGRAVQAQSLSSVTLRGGTFENNSDAAVFVSEPILADISGVTIRGASAASIPGASSLSGDGIVVTSGGGNYAPGTFLARLTDNDVSATARAGIVVDGEALQVETLLGNTLASNGYTSAGISIVVQHGAVVPAEGDPHAVLDASSTLEVNLATVGLDDVR